MNTYSPGAAGGRRGGSHIGGPPVGVVVSVEIDVATVRRGDQVMVGGQAFVVSDMVNVAAGGKRLCFRGGESFTMCRTTVLWAARRVNPRRLPSR
ncbi:hypothetical protein [Streptomyces johnsoniae]|uniref:Uncharacterized protein n=1 Tax=Streptomyces johnsoniae TaxID=3075532 RepID=A0ABU2S6U1_9ACTN|nr:hypothetical protein [Streptomyces sp. DSM 41886]MDT0443355.1 hypothetical protein [Streptomyces sp. DSM 41886]